MNLRLEDKTYAIKLRKKGYTYNEIRKVIPNLSKGTLSGWLKFISLSSHQKQRILTKIKKGSEYSRLKGAWTNKQKAIKRILLIQEIAEKEFANLSGNYLFYIGLSLYWAEGSKKNRCFQFINSDPLMIKLILKWLTEILGVEKNDIRLRIYMHKIYEKENCEDYWLNISGLSKAQILKTVYKPSVHKVKKNLEYKGCCRVELRGSELFWKIVKWQELMIEKFK